MQFLVLTSIFQQRVCSDYRVSHILFAMYDIMCKIILISFRFVAVISAQPGRQLKTAAKLIHCCFM